MGNWLKAHKKQALTHTFVVVGVVLLVLFAAEPLFDRLDGISGQAQLQQIALPTESADIMYALDSVSTESTLMLEIIGWAFIEGHDMELDDCTTYIVLRSQSHTYVFDTSPRRSGDIAARFGRSGLNLDWAGFVTNIPLRMVLTDEYTIGIYIKTGDVEALQFTNRRISLP